VNTAKEDLSTFSTLPAKSLPVNAEERKPKTKAEIRKIYDQFDEDNSGLWEATEMIAFIDSLPNKHELGDPESIFGEIDKDGSGEIDFDEFYHWYQTNFSQRVSEVAHDAKPKTKAEIRKIFNSFDMDNSGLWEVTEMIAFIGSLPNKHELGDPESIFGEIDKDGSGEIDFDEFYHWYNKTFVAREVEANLEAAEEPFAFRIPFF
jgi:Ca2+-binding EF-hand superfamily protein